MEEESVRQMYLAGVRRWPSVRLEFEPFEAHCRALFAPETDPIPREGADLYLCCACANGDSEALSVFEHETLGVARAAIEKIRRDSDFTEETLQELWQKLLLGPNAKVAGYSGRGPLKAWVRIAATRAALDRCRAQRVSATRQTELTDGFAGPGFNPELFVSKLRYAEAFQSALQEAVAALPRRERNALRMHVCGHCSIDEIGRAYNVHRATAARWLERGRTSIHDALRAGLFRRDVRLSDSEFKSLALGMGNELELRLSQSHARSQLALDQSDRKEERSANGSRR
jgi:RNA polymerase sigma-70 factor (ECF subfamily)